MTCAHTCALCMNVARVYAHISRRYFSAVLIPLIYPVARSAYPRARHCNFNLVYRAFIHFKMMI